MTDLPHAPSQSEAENRLYADRVKVYPRKVKGTFRRIKWIMLGLVLTLYYGLPFIRFDRGAGLPDQAILIDMEARRAYFFWIEIWPQEVYILTGVLIFAAVALFFITSIAGRLWCAYACPQTVWTDLFMWIERLIEGDAPERRKRDQGPLTADKALRKTATHTAWLAISVMTGGAWILYFQNAPTAIPEVLGGHAAMGTYFFIGLFTATTYLLGGWAREQVCTYMCPWPRFQSAMFDEDTLVVTYQGWRGEPRSRHHKKALAKGEPVGDCVDCGLCVQVCPTGIDIRDGVQLECIGCGLCVDACNTVMEKLGAPRDLIRHDTERNMRNREMGIQSKYRLIRPRTLIYATMLAVVGLGLLTALLSRADTDINLIHDRNPLYQRLSDGSIRNGFTLKVLNKTHTPQQYEIALSGIEGLTMRDGRTVGAAWEDSLIVDATPNGVTPVRFFVHAPQKALKGDHTTMTIAVTNLDTGIRTEEETVFRGPK